MDRRDPQTYAVIGAAMEVHRELGPGFLEGVYQDALDFELTDRKIAFVREQELPIYYKGRKLKRPYRADFVCHGDLIVELKAAAALTGADESQLLNYLKATRVERGLLVNFGRASLEFKRMILSRSGGEPAGARADIVGSTEESQAQNGVAGADGVGG